ncbi:pRL2-23 [Streptomyces iconiensis]|uniref:PRL2-23 n=2 Tax=Streptomyces iconiensis TaxID=1384038 RepID=A0ABT7A4Y3_9ACTN|nr:pRL2-23 [Streptomyces iconiensis]MDJ1136390.1 pRL2-23 [Streptomyces iconiensis]
MWTSLVAVIGTLAGALVSGLLQHRVARTDRSDARAEQLRRDRMDAVTALARSVSDHRRAMWQVRDAELTGQSAERVEELRDESHRTRSEITDPAVRLKLLFTDSAVRTAAQEAAQATYRMRECTTLDQLQAGRAAALAAHDDFVSVCGDFLA